MYPIPEGMGFIAPPTPPRFYNLLLAALLKGTIDFISTIFIRNCCFGAFDRVSYLLRHILTFKA